jgi:hypothetical protein
MILLNTNSKQNFLCFQVYSINREETQAVKIRIRFRVRPELKFGPEFKGKIGRKQIKKTENGLVRLPDAVEAPTYGFGITDPAIRREQIAFSNPEIRKSRVVYRPRI